jgi:ParB-like chromosome segregation protein Spo0J
VWLSIGRKLNNGTIISKWHGLFEILDGNHRIIAAKLANLHKIKAIMPESHYKFYKEIGCDKNS